MTSTNAKVLVVEDDRLIRRLLRSVLPSRGFVVTEAGKAAGYGFYVLEEYKGLIGGLFVSSDVPQEPVTRKLISEMVAALHATLDATAPQPKPRLRRAAGQRR